MVLKKRTVEEDDSIGGGEGLKAGVVKPWPKKPRKISGSRWAIVVVLAGSLAACGVLFFYAKIADFRSGLTEPWRLSSVVEQTGEEVARATPTPDTGELLTQVGEITEGLRGKYGFYVKHIGNGSDYGLKQDEVYPAASLMKLPVIIALYEEAETGKLDLETEYVLKAADKAGGAGVLQGKANGSSWSYRQMVEMMGKYSDNTAFAVFRRLLGDERIEKTIGKIGLEKTSLASFESSPAEIGKLFYWLYSGGLAKNSREEILAFLTETIYEERIPAGVPEGIRVAHKVGTDLGVFADGGIVFAEKPYVLVIMTEGARDDEAKEAVVKISRAVWNFENR